MRRPHAVNKYQPQGVFSFMESEHGFHRRLDDNALAKGGHYFQLSISITTRLHLRPDGRSAFRSPLTSSFRVRRRPRPG
jgi:hypothetical protein